MARILNPSLLKELNKRVKTLQQLLEENSLNAYLVSSTPNLLYLTGIETGKVLITTKHSYLWVKELYFELYENFLGNDNYPFKVKVYREGVIPHKISRLKLRKIGVENLPVLSYRRLKKKLSFHLLPLSLVENMRAVKSAYEIKQLKKAAVLAKKAMEKAEELLEIGKRERDIAAEIESFLRKQGSQSPPFSSGMLLAGGARGAEIHAYPSSFKLGNGLVVVDLGARINNYYSDMTRTFVVGKVNNNARKKIEFVRNLEMEVIDSLHVGMNANEIYTYAEKKLENRGYKLYHGLGHGVGLTIHESPSIAPKSEDILKENMVFTIEPGIYLPGKYGIRFEDMVWLKKNKAIKLTS